jgi:hypothetical protein
MISIMYLSEPTAGFRDESFPELPKMWIGFVLALGFLVAELYEAAIEQNDRLGLWTIVTAIAGTFYWLFCVHRFHIAVNRLAAPLSISESGTTYPVSPGGAVGRHFIPVYNIFWLFKWPKTMADFLNESTSVRMMSGTLLGFIVLLSFVVLRALDGFFGLSALFWIGAYLNKKLRQAMDERRDQKNVAEVFA